MAWLQTMGGTGTGTGTTLGSRSEDLENRRYMSSYSIPFFVLICAVKRLALSIHNLEKRPR